MSLPVVVVTGSPATTSRSSLVARRVARELELHDLSATFFSLADFDAADVFHGRTQAASVMPFLRAVGQAPALVFSTPVYKATYSGGLKAIVDLIAPDAIVGRPTLGIATVKLEAHAVEVATAYANLFRFFRTAATETLVVRDAEVTIHGDALTFLDGAEHRVVSAARSIAEAIRG
jgi:FMN reductase